MQNVKLATMLARAASFFDDQFNCMPPEYKGDVIKHIENLHDVAGILAGDDLAQVYNAEELQRFTVGAQYTNTIQFGGEEISLVHQRSRSGEVGTIIVISHGAFNLALFAGPHKVRELILALRQLVDECDASTVQHAETLPLHQAAGLCVAGEAA